MRASLAYLLTILIASAAGPLAGCGAARTAPPLPADGAAAPAPAEPGTAALNTRLLAQVSPAGGEDLPIGPGDLVEVSVFEVQELTGLKVRVPVRGTVTLPLIGEVPASGRTAQELEAAIRERLQEKYMHDPQVSVFVLEQKSQRISVLGAVRRGGVYPMTSQLRLADALALAEGLADDADHVVYLIRRVPAGTVALAQAGQPVAAAPPPAGGPTEEVMARIDLEQLASGRDELNVVLQAGDVIQVPKAGSYYVSGSVERPGSFFLKTRTTLQQAISAAGGVTSTADWDDVRIYRTHPDGSREVLDFSLEAIEKGAPAPEIRKHDVIVVGKSYAKAFFFGVADFFKGIFGFSKGI
ncbi:MAG TPA: polysaccharide biosynthesis/export family protein [Thermodesulfobacteriota bacterium]